MSSSKFGSGEKKRIAHHDVNPESSNLQADLAAKKLALSKMISSSLSAKKTPTKSPLINRKYGKTKKVKRSKREESEEEDEFIDDEGVSEEDENYEEDDNDDDDEPVVRKRKTPATKKLTEFVTKKVSPKEESRRVRTLSDSSDDEWLTKPRLDSENATPSKAAMKTNASRKNHVRKKIVIEESDEEVGNNDQSEEDIDAEVPVKKAKKKVVSDEDWEEDDDDLNADGDETPSDDSDAEERRSKRPESMNQKKCREFFNSATKEDLLMQPRLNEKLADFIISKRPFDAYKEMVAVIKTIPRGTNAIDSYMEHLEKRGILEKILDDCKDHADTVTRDFERCTEGPLHLKLLNEGCKLHEYQQIGVKWLIMMNNKELNAILGDEMGLGKTIQIVSFLSYLKQTGKPGPHLIVVPSSTIENWIGEFKKWCPAIKLLTYYGNQDERKHLRHRVKKQKDNIDVILTTYNMVISKSDDKKFFKNFSLNYVIYDEGHMLKNCDSERYRGLMKVKGKRKILLTGTPLQNNLIELISLMYFVLFKVFNKYCEDITHLLKHFKQVGPALESKNRDLYQQDRIEQAKTILQPYILRRLKDQVLGSLPPKSETVIETDLRKEQKQLYDDIFETLKNCTDPGESMGGLMRLRQAANHPLLRRFYYSDITLDKIAKTLCAKEKAYTDKKWDEVSEDLSYLSDIKIHQLCEKFTSTSKYLLEEDLALNSGKIDQLDILLPEIQKKGDKVLIFSQFTSMLDILEVYLGIRKYNYKRLDGQTPVMERQEMINEFNISDEIFIFLLSTKAGGLGINLTSANHIIIHDIDFNPYNDKQAEARCHRMGQKKEVFITRLISKGTVEARMLSLAKKKLKLEKQVTDGIKGQLDEDELRELKEEEENEMKIDKNSLKQLLTSVIKGEDDEEEENGSRSPSV